ncbi:hypothetical protein CR513_38735, partial [Mucuna pruriens]
MAEGSSPHSQTSSPRGGYKVEDANEDDPFRKTELFEDTLVLNSPFPETEVENLNLDTAIVEDSEPAENMTTSTMCEYEEVVLDSEDEEMNDRDVGKGPTLKIPSTLFQKRQPKPPCELVDPNGTTFGKSAAGMCLLIFAYFFCMVSLRVIFIWVTNLLYTEVIVYGALHE